MKIIIIGAGIAGCAAYLELRKHLQQPDGCNEPHEIRIYEAYDTSADIAVGEILEEHSHSSKILVGGGLGITSNGLNVLRRLDEELLLDVVRGGYVTATSNMKSKDGWSLFSLPNNSSTKSDEISYTVATSRHQFWKALRRRIPDDHIIHKRTSRVVARRNGRNLVCFSDGTPAVEADLVIGADGVRSTVKAALFPDADEDPYPPRYE